MIAAPLCVLTLVAESLMLIIAAGCRKSLSEGIWPFVWGGLGILMACFIALILLPAEGFGW